MTVNQDSKPKSSKAKWVVLGACYLVVITAMAWASIGKAIDKSQEMGVYQIDKTREFLGEEKAQEMQEFYDSRVGAKEANPATTDSEATDTPKR